MTKQKPHNYSLHQLILAELNFSRDQSIDVKDVKELRHEENIDVKASNLVENKFSVALDYTYTIVNKDKEVVKIKVVQIGNFTCDPSPDPDNLELFMHINGPAIIFPFVREVIANVTSKAMLGGILIQPVNFVQLYQDKKKKENNGS